MGGLKINIHAQVVDVEGHIIKDCMQLVKLLVVHAGNRLGGNALADIFTFGRIAGQSAVMK